jgi:8-oxo-dGTP pyrophosphatase MutT (NUDIX family)
MPDTSKQHIRPIAICVFRSDGYLFVLEGHDEVKRETFYRPIGGGIEFWEASRAAVIREIKEEIGVEVDGLSYLGTLENIFVHRGDQLHEIVQVYEGGFVDPAMNDPKRIVTGNEEGTPFKALWIPMDAFRRGELTLYPSGLLELIEQIPEPLS